MRLTAKKNGGEYEISIHELHVVAWAHTVENSGVRLVRCEYFQREPPFEFRDLAHATGTLTLKEAQKCITQVNAACFAAGL